MMTSIETIDQWTTKLTGLPADRIARARERIDPLGVEHLSNELTRASLRPGRGTASGAARSAHS